MSYDLDKIEAAARASVAWFEAHGNTGSTYQGDPEVLVPSKTVLAMVADLRRLERLEAFARDEGDPWGLCRPPD